MAYAYSTLYLWMGPNMCALAVVVLLAIAGRTGAEIVGCGGFVEVRAISLLFIL